jgi:excisionase family DNA binding protein
MAAGRFLQLTDVAEILNISSSQTYALVRSGELPAIKIGGRGQWRVERTVLEDYIQRCYAETRAFVRAQPVSAGELTGEVLSGGALDDAALVED